MILGLWGGPQGWAATLASTGQQLDAAPGPLYNKAGLPEVALVVRKAGLPVNGDWAIQLARGQLEAGQQQQGAAAHAEQ